MSNDVNRELLTWMQTHSGIQVFVNELQPDFFNIEDIAHALSNNCRYAGHTKEFYSVAEHSVLVSELMQAKMLDNGEDVSSVENLQKLLLALLHDASEAYITDIAKPVKDQIAHAYIPLEKRFMAAIWEQFGLTQAANTLYFDVGRYDWEMLIHEKEAVIAFQGHIWESNLEFEAKFGKVKPLKAYNNKKLKIKMLPPKKARQLFMDRFLELTSRLEQSQQQAHAA